ncbi:MAG: hypothetical protein V8Q37_00230 [Angelakisella sp.]
MKKVLALVLAVIMVCTMAMAVEVNTPTTPGNSTSDYAYSVTLYPGKSIIFDKADLGMTDVSDDDVKAGKYNVDITFERGADFIASKGWVKTATGYRYVLTAKDSVVAIDGTPDIIISAIKVTKVGQNKTFYSAQYTDKLADGTATYATHTKDGKPTVTAQDFKPMKDIADSTNGIALCLGFDFGYEPGKIVIAKDGKSVTPDAFVENTLYSVVRTQEANAKSSVTLGKYATTENPFGYTYTLKAGETVMFANIGNVNIDNTTAAGKALNKNLLDRDATIVAKLENELMPNKAVSITVDGAKDGYKVYMVKADGSVVDLGATFNANKVLTATATLTGPVIVTDKAITATAASTGTTTNPGTGANDVVGVAAALAVVALVSGAAISLKK